MFTNSEQEIEVFKTLYDEAPCGFLSTDRNGLILRVNQYFLNLTGFDNEELVRKQTLQDLLTVGGKLYYETHYRPLLTHSGEAREISFYLKAKSGERIPILINTKSRKLFDGSIEYISTILDTSQRKSYEKELLIAKQQAEQLTAKLSESNDELKRFAHVVTHDIKTPISNIVLMFEFLEANFTVFTDEKKLEYLSKIKAASFRLSDMVTRILSYYTNSDLSKMQPDLIVIKDLYQKILEVCDPEQHIQATLNNKSISIKTYGVVLELILLNLIVNALKYNDKEIVKIRLSQDEDDRFYYFNVTDNGQGISNEHINTIFEPLKTLGKKDRFNQKGTGLGLSYVKKMVTKLRGSISVTSDVGVGSTFSFSIAKM